MPLCINGIVEHKNWFNVDVMLIKPDFIRDNFENILTACKFVYDNKYPYWENDALNYLFSEKYLKLPYRFNSIVADIRRTDPKPYHIEEAIYHFAGAKPDLNTDDVFNRLYWEYFLKTPYANARMFGTVHKFCEKLYDNSKFDLLRFTNLIATHERAFLVEANAIEGTKKIFEVKDNEKIFNASNPEDMEKFYADIEESRGKKIFFILSGNYWNIGRTLLQKKFVEGVDFVNALSFLSKQHGIYIPFDSRPIVQEM